MNRIKNFIMECLFILSVMLFSIFATLMIGLR